MGQGSTTSIHLSVEEPLLPLRQQMQSPAALELLIPRLYTVLIQPQRAADPGYKSFACMPSAGDFETQALRPVGIVLLCQQSSLSTQIFTVCHLGMQQLHSFATVFPVAMLTMFAVGDCVSDVFPARMSKA